MSIEHLHANQRVIKTPHGEVLGCSYHWPGGQYCAIHTDRGVIGCGLYDCSIATRFGMAVAIARGTPESPLREPEDRQQQLRHLRQQVPDRRELRRWGLQLHGGADAVRDRRGVL